MYLVLELNVYKEGLIFFSSLSKPKVNTMLEKICEVEHMHSTLKKHVWLQHGKELTEESNTIKILNFQLAVSAQISQSKTFVNFLLRCGQMVLTSSIN